VAHPAVLAGRYALVTPLGRGGMGQVWEGRDERLGRPVAVKLLTSEALAAVPQPDGAVRRFTREAAVTAGLAHPGVPATYDAGEYDGGLFLVMELVDGCTVADLIAEHGALPVPWVAAIAAQVAAVLAAAHDRGIIHRDIKPQNVMLTSDATAKVLDFGIAGLYGQRITSTGAMVGTPAYMAPEQLHDHPVTPRTDLYALGCLLYEMLAGEPVFAATSPAGLMRLHLDATPAPLLRPGVPPGLDALVRQLLEKDPARRPSDAMGTLGRLLPYVVPLGPLGDISPASGEQDSMAGYSVLMARLRGGVPGPAAGPVPGYGGPPTVIGYLPGAVGVPAAFAPWQPRQQPARRNFGWTLLHSLWVLPTLAFGAFTWLSFGYIAIRHQRASWGIAAVVYLVLPIVYIVLLNSGPVNRTTPEQTAGVILFLVTWAGGFVHAVWVNAAVRLPLRSAGR
jgi:hypothetical protein